MALLLRAGDYPYRVMQAVPTENILLKEVLPFTKAVEITVTLHKPSAGISCNEMIFLLIWTYFIKSCTKTYNFRGKKGC